MGILSLYEHTSQFLKINSSFCLSLYLSLSLSLYLSVSHALRHISTLFFFFFFDVDHFKILYLICCNIASVLCFDFLAARNIGS